MIRVTFLEHSGFFVELESCCLLFDWWKGDLPALSGKPLFVLVSHRHPDHFDPQIFALDDGMRDVYFVLSKDIRLSDRNRTKWGISSETAGKCVSMGARKTLSLPGLTVETLPSTDEGVAFLITCGDQTLYHAGDLNWWHWEGEDNSWNRNMEVNFKRDLSPLQGHHLDLAFAPLDPRLENAYDWGFRYLLELADVKHIFPMHQWGNFSSTARFCAAHPEFAQKVISVGTPGQHWEFFD